MLAEIVAQALGAKKPDGTIYTAADYLAGLEVEEDAPPAAPAPTQTAAEIEARIRMWVSGNNRAWTEDPARGGK